MRRCRCWTPRASLCRACGASAMPMVRGAAAAQHVACTGRCVVHGRSLPLAQNCTLHFMLALWDPADWPTCQSCRVVQMLSQLYSVCCRQVHACTCRQRPGHQRRGEHVWAPTCAQPCQRPSCLLHPPRGTSCSGLEPCDHKLVAFEPLQKSVAASAAIGRSADRCQLLCDSRWLCRLSGCGACILVCVANGCMATEQAAAASCSLGDLCWIHGWVDVPLSPVCTWPQVSFVGATEEQAREAAQKAGYGDKLAVVKTSFRANSKASGTQGWQS